MGLKIRVWSTFLCVYVIFEEEEYNERVSHATIQGDVTLSHEQKNSRPFTAAASAWIYLKKGSNGLMSHVLSESANDASKLIIKLNPIC